MSAAMPGVRVRRAALYLTEIIGATGGTFMSVGIFFYTEHRLGWSVRQNLLLAAAQGMVYVPGALLAHPLTQWLGRRRVILALYALLAAVSLFATLYADNSRCVAGALVAYSLIIGTSWPVLESLVSGRAGPKLLSQRLALYNSAWAGIGVVALAVSGTLIERIPDKLFLVPMGAHLLGGLILLLNRQAEEDVADTGGGHAMAPEPALLRQRRVALWLSRISMPATYMVIYALAAMLPSLPLVKELPPRLATPLCSVWLLTRWAAFCVLGMTAAWHGRPRLLLWSAAVMLLAFLGVVLPAALLERSWVAVSLMALAQATLGAAVGMIYAGSLYFGMVLSEGSTEHGGYHEALIGLGMVLGPGSAAIAQWLRPGDAMPGIVAVAAVLSLTLVAAGAAALGAGRPREGD